MGATFPLLKQLLNPVPVIIVLGMHRSGTSLVASMIHKMGIPMGVSLLEPDEFNPYGYWEDIEIKDLNKALLEAIGGNWDDFVTRKEILIAMPPFLNRMKTIADSRNSEDLSKIRWGFKDPRTCLTVWAWTKVLPDARYVVVHRAKKAVIQSLKKTGREGSWNRLYRHYWGHIRTFIELNQDTKFYHVAYEDLMDERFQVCAVMGLAEFIGEAGRVEDGLKMIHQS